MSSLSPVKSMQKKKCKDYAKPSYKQLTVDNMFIKLACMKYTLLFIWNFVWGS